jgi:hypothetical protein
MPDFDRRIQLIGKISEARMKFQSIARPYMKSCFAALEQGQMDIDIPGNQPPELTPLYELIRELENELLMLDPATQFVNVTRDYREIMANARIGRMQNDAYFQSIEAEISSSTSGKSVEPPASVVPQPSQPNSPEPQPFDHPHSKPRKFTETSERILAILTSMGLNAPGKFTLNAAILDKFCVEADKQKIPTPLNEGWRKSWKRTFELEDGGKRRVRAYLHALAQRNRSKQ